MSESALQRYIVTVGITGVTNNQNTQCDWVTVALCSDGSLWQLRNTDTEWEILPPIPQSLGE